MNGRRGGFLQVVSIQKAGTSSITVCEGQLMLIWKVAWQGVSVHAVVSRIVIFSHLGALWHISLR